jgi:hypothetical protein
MVLLVQWLVQLLLGRQQAVWVGVPMGSRHPRLLACHLLQVSSTCMTVAITAAAGPVVLLLGLLHGCQLLRLLLVMVRLVLIRLLKHVLLVLLLLWRSPRERYASHSACQGVCLLCSIA